MYKILLVEDQKSVAATLRAVLEHKHFQVFTAPNVADGVAIFDAESPDVVVTDVRMEPLTGIDLLRTLRQKKSTQLVILMTAYEEMSIAVEALKLGAFDYLAKPFPVTDLVAVINRGLAYSQATQGSVDLSLIIGSPRTTEDMVIESEAMQKTMKVILQIAPTHAFVMVSGEKGTGKSMVARTLHRLGAGKDKPFREIDCSALDSSTIHLEDSGTIFLDRVDKLTPALQKEMAQAILRVKDNQDAPARPGMPHGGPRIISSTDADMEKVVRSAMFDPDLFTVLSERVIDIPPLRDRAHDILPITHSILKRETGATGGQPPQVALDVCRVLEWYAWPENGDELARTIKEMLAAGAGGSIRMQHLPERLRQVGESLSQRKQADLKSQFMYAEALKRFIQEKGRQKFDALLSSVKTDRQTAGPVNPTDNADSSLANRLNKLRGDSATLAPPNRP